MQDHYDYIIVGAGSAGCVLANRLSARPELRVLLVEAGGPQRNVWTQVLGGLHKVAQQNHLDWDFVSAPEPGLGNRQIKWPRGRVLGGSSTVNGMVYIRGQPEDYDAWCPAGTEGWGWKDVLPYFRRSEKQARGADPWHGADGMLEVSDLPDRHPISDAFIEAAVQYGLPRNDDFNGPRQEGAGYYQYTMGRRFRSSTARGYLKPARARPNLTVLTHTLVTGIDFNGDRAVGISAVGSDGARRSFHAGREVVLSAGAVKSPHLLLLSGVGPADELRRFGIKVVLDQPELGQGLQDHLQVKLGYRIGADVETVNHILHSPVKQFREFLRFVTSARGALVSGSFMAGGFLRSSPSVSRPDIQLHFQPLSAPPEGGFDRFGGCTLTVSQVRPASRGEIRLASSHPAAAPVLRANYFMEPMDRNLVVVALRTGREIMSEPAFAPYALTEIRPGAAVHTDAALLDHARRTGLTQFHLIGGCCMAAGPHGVVDPDLRVKGLRGLRVIDASIMPAMVSGNTNAAAIMIGERGSDLILGCR